MEAHTRAVNTEVAAREETAKELEQVGCGCYTKGTFGSVGILLYITFA